MVICKVQIIPMIGISGAYGQKGLRTKEILFCRDFQAWENTGAVQPQLKSGRGRLQSQNLSRGGNAVRINKRHLRVVRCNRAQHFTNPINIKFHVLIIVIRHCNYSILAISSTFETFSNITFLDLTDPRVHI